MENKNYQLTPKIFIKTLSVLHLAFFGGLLLFGVFVYHQNKEWKLNMEASNTPFLIMVLVVAIGGIWIGNYLYQRQIGALTFKNSLRQKLAGFQTASLIKYALIEAPILLATGAAMNSGNLSYLFLAVPMMGYFYLQRPPKKKVERDLALKGELQNQFNEADKPIK